MQAKPTGRRPHGTGALIERDGSYYGKWRVGGQQIKRKLGPVRTPSSRDGLTKAQAEAKLRSLIGEAAAPPVERLTVAEAAERLLTHLEVMGRKHSTLRSYKAIVGAQIKPRLGTRPIALLSAEQIERFAAEELSAGLKPKTIANALGLLSVVCEHAVKRGWAPSNPCRGIERPRTLQRDTALRFLDPVEVEALLRAVPADDFARVRRAIYVAAVMAGLRQGELLALQWRDVDWSAQRLRVRRNYVRGRFGTPKSSRGSRSVPLADRLGGELDLLHRSTAYGADDDLVFAHPHTGEPMNGHALLKVFQRTLRAAGVRQVRFHDLRHTFGTRMAASGVPMRTLQEWMGHADIATTLRYADYAPSAHELQFVNAAFAGTSSGTSLSTTQSNSGQLEPVNPGSVGSVHPV
jgi:integrase